MQSVSSRIWTRVAVSISFDDNHYTTGTSSISKTFIMPTFDYKFYSLILDYIYTLSPVSITPFFIYIASNIITKIINTDTHIHEYIYI